MKQTTRNLGTLITGAQNIQHVLNQCALNGLEATRTITLNVKGMEFVRLAYVFTKDAATSLTFTPSLSFDNGTTYCPITAKAVSAGTATVSPYVDSRTVSASENGVLDWYDVRGADKLKVVIAGGGVPTASDKIDVFGIGVLGT